MSNEVEVSQDNTEETNTEDAASKLYDSGKEEAEKNESSEDVDSKEEESKDDAVEEASESEAEEEINYEISLSKDSKLKQDDVDSVLGFAKEHNLSNEVAQKILAEKESQVDQFMEGLKSEHERRTQQWLEDSTNDPEIGGEKLKLSAERAKRAIEAFGTPELSEALDTTGYGNHPEVVKIFSKIGQLIEDDKIVMPGKSGVARSQADILYGNN